ncbi:MAG: FAD-dependent oxidoreductase [bacterium]
MKRDIAQLADKQFDVVIIGGGIYGVCTAWDAALRGLSVALVEKGDFGSATSSNSLKIIHGGLRYLQHADFKRMRESILERSTLMHIAPHLVHPLPCIMPTYGHALKSKQVMAVALLLNDLIGFDRNRNLEPQKHLPNGRVVSKRECQELIPGIDEKGLTGGAIWYDCQVRNAERMLISILRSAVAAGATAANYVEMVGFAKDRDQITGIVARDVFTRDRFEIAARLVINNSGPWVNNILSHLNGYYSQPLVRLSAAMNIVVKKQLNQEFAVGVWSKTQFKDADAVISKGSRLLFITPWRQYSIIGTTHVPYDGDPGNFRITERDIAGFIQEINEAYPTANLTRNDVAYFYGGMLPVEGHDQKSGDVNLMKHYKIIDHKETNGLDGLITVVGVKYTTARDVAEKTVDFVFQKMGQVPPKSICKKSRIFGGVIDGFQKFVTEEKAKALKESNENIIEHLIYNYGSEYPRLLNYCKEDPEWAQTVDATTQVLKAEVVHAVREEMALKLTDVVRRRTELGTAEAPTGSSLATSAELMANELKWDKPRIQREIAEARALYLAAETT